MVTRIDRETTFNIQLPQKFLRDDLKASHTKAKDSDLRYTEDAMLCAEIGGFDVYSQQGWSTNIKITTADDFRLAEAILQGLEKND